MTAGTERADRGWRRFWALTLAAFALFLAPTVVDLYRLYSARRASDLPMALAASNDLSKGFFGPLLAPWLDDVSMKIRDEVIEENLLSIRRLVPDSQESAYAEMELGRLAVEKGDYTASVIHLERYLKSGLGRDIQRARMLLSDAYRETKRYDEAALLLRVVLKETPDPQERMESSFRLGELYQFHLGRVDDAVEIYKNALEDKTAQGRWRNDILTNLSLLKE
ncbi:tetratricopeptide repeat protein [bacterium]|nr:tetratricopeptide repeat protein [bacterium]